jgi:ATP phosphoribosyltransferase regulatory subunit
MRPITPRGFRDVLSDEAAEREAIAQALSEVFSAWGYDLVQTPVVERLDALEAAAGPLEGTAFRLLDLDGQMLALRPDMTVPIARVAASRLEGERGPHRFRYIADVFREHESLRGQARQFSQAGIELLGAGGPQADAEVVALMVAALRASGLPEFTVAVGTVEVFSAIVDSAAAGDEWGAEVLAAAHERNLVELARLADTPGIDARAARALREVPRIRGGVEAIEACRAATQGCGCSDALDALAETYALLSAYGADDCVAIDFSVMRSFDYYTGLVAEAYVPGLGVPVGGGGRYDGVLASFDAPQPAAGFALGLERLQIALVEQGAQPSVRGVDALVGGAPADVARACARLRAAGWRAVASARTGLELVREADSAGAVEALLAHGDSLVRLDRQGGLATPLEEPIPYPPTTSWARGGDER